ncbi:tape measure protein [Tepidimicrobium xylanilyticum]
MASIKSSLNLIDNMSRVLDRVTGKTDKMKRSIDSAKRVMNKETRIVYTLDSAGRAQARLAGATDIATKKFEQQDNQVKKNVNSTDALEKKLKKLGRTLGAAYSVKKIIALTDQITATTARLDLMNDGLQTTAELQEKIFQSAQRARGSYLTTASAVSQMGILAADAFASNDEVIAFVEQLNKHFTIAGTSAQGIDAAMLQITQAMGQGVLRGEELNSVFEQAPTIIQSIAKYLDVPIGKIRELAQEGKITSQIVKNAMFATAEETNAKFAQMPMTFSDVSAVIGNTLLQTFEPVLQLIGRGAQWIYDNWSTLEPIFWGLTAAVGAYAVGTWIAKVAQEGLNLAMLKSPVFLVAAGIGVLVALIYKWIKSVGGIRIAWLIAVNAILTYFDWLKIDFIAITYAIINFTGKMKVEVLKLIQGMVNGAIDLINKFISAVNKLPGVALKTIDKVTFATAAQIKFEAKAAERDAALNRMMADARAATARRQAEIRAAQEEAAKQGDDSFADMYSELLKNVTPPNLDEIGKNAKNIADNTKAIKDSVDASQEDLKWLRDIAEQEVINRFTTATLAPQISIEFGDVKETADVDGIIGRLEEILIEQLNIAAEGVHS